MPYENFSSVSSSRPVTVIMDFLTLSIYAKAWAQIPLINDSRPEAPFLSSVVRIGEIPSHATGSTSPCRGSVTARLSARVSGFEEPLVQTGPTSSEENVALLHGIESYESRPRGNNSAADGGLRVYTTGDFYLQYPASAGVIHRRSLGKQQLTPTTASA
jgi:hypothetical protein